MKKMPVQLISYVNDFYVFLCYFDLLFLLFFSVKFVADNFWSTIMLKQFISAMDNKQFNNYVKKLNALILYTKSHFGAIFGPTSMYKKLRNFRTAPAQNVRETWKKKVIKVAALSNTNFRPPPSLFTVVSNPLSVYTNYFEMKTWIINLFGSFFFNKSYNV